MSFHQITGNLPILHSGELLLTTLGLSICPLGRDRELYYFRMSLEKVMASMLDLYSIISELCLSVHFTQKVWTLLKSKDLGKIVFQQMPLIIQICEFFYLNWFAYVYSCYKVVQF